MIVMTMCSSKIGDVVMDDVSSLGERLSGFGGKMEP